MPENEKSDSEDYMYAKFSCRVLFEGGFSRYITEDMVKKLVTAVLIRHPMTQEELASFCFDDEDIEKYGLEHLIAGGYKKRST